MSQAEVPLEWIHVFHGKWVHSFLPLPFKTKSREVLIGYEWYVSEGQRHAHFIDTKRCLQYDLMKSV